MTIDKETREAQIRALIEESRRKEAEAARERRGYPHQFRVGDGATMRIGSDARPPGR